MCSVLDVAHEANARRRGARLGALHEAHLLGAVARDGERGVGKCLAHGGKRIHHHVDAVEGLELSVGDDERPRFGRGTARG